MISERNDWSCFYSHAIHSWCFIRLDSIPSGESSVVLLSILNSWRSAIYPLNLASMLYCCSKYDMGMCPMPKYRLPYSHGPVFHTFGTPGLSFRYFLVLLQHKDPLCTHWVIKATKRYWSWLQEGGWRGRQLCSKILFLQSYYTNIVGLSCLYPQN